MLRIFAVSAPGLEEIAAAEITQLDVRGVTRIDGGVELTGPRSILYDANLRLRTVSRIVVRLAEFHASSFHELERRAARVAWEEYLVPGSHFQFRVTCRKSRLYHSDAVAERFAEAVVKRVPGTEMVKAGTEASDATEIEHSDESSSQLFIVRLSNDNCVVSADSSGSLLHRRGYRLATGKAPLRETLAAAMVMGSGWDGRAPLVDPMCGSGTIVIEAAMMARGIAPGLRRRFAFESWPAHDSQLWSSLREKALEEISSGASGVLMASDRDDGVVSSLHNNAERAGVASDIETKVQAISALEPPKTPGFIVTNPPYGVRVGDATKLRNLYAQLGNVLRARARGYTLAMLSASAMLEASLDLPLEKVFRTTNGGIPVRLVKGSIS
jgi:putative N6-adenine-specific DNA methylase